MLGSTNPNSTITVPSSNGSPFQKPEVITSPIQTSSTNGYHSSTYSQIAGTSLNGDITIDQWNNSLSFQFTDAGIPIPVNFDVPDGSSLQAVHLIFPANARLTLDQNIFWDPIAFRALSLWDRI